MEQDLTSQDFQLKTAKSSPKKQTANDKLDESLGARDGKESTKSQSFKDRRDESKA